MDTATHRKASSAHRARAKSKGLARVELQVPKGDVALAEQFAEGLRGARSDDLRKAIEGTLKQETQKSGLDLFSFATDEQQAALDELFEDILSEPRSSEIREIDL